MTHPHLHWTLDPGPLAAMAVGSVIYVRRFRAARQEAGGRGAGWLHAAAFAGCVAVLLAALVSPLDGLGENYLFFSRVTGENKGNPAQNLKSRDELIKALRESYDYGAKVWAGLTEEKALEMIEVRDQKVQRWSAILNAIQDNMNHYGNLVVYVRLNGLVPPRSAGR